MPATPASSTSRCASSTPRSVAGRLPRPQLGGNRQVRCPRRAALASATALSGSSSSAAPGAGLADLAHRAAHVEVDHVGAGVGGHRRGLAHDRRVVAEELDRDRMLVGVDAQELLDRALVAVGEAEAGDHLGGDQAGPEAPRLKPHEPVADAGERSQHEPVLERRGRRASRVGECGHAGRDGSRVRQADVAFPDQLQAGQGEQVVDFVDLVAGRARSRRRSRPWRSWWPPRPAPRGGGRRFRRPGRRSRRPRRTGSPPWFPCRSRAGAPRCPPGAAARPGPPAPPARSRSPGRSPRPGTRRRPRRRRS